jgi:hypothetical protein
VNTTLLRDKEHTKSHLLSLLSKNKDVAEEDFKYIFAPFFLKPTSFFSIRYVDKCNNILP